MVSGSDMMKAARLHKIGDFRVDEVAIPVPTGEELLVKIGACGLCGSDIPRIFEHGTSSHLYPLTLGHEFSGTIVAVGENADTSLIGKKGSFFPLIPCRRCDSCLSGNYAMCEDYDYMGSRCNGGFAEYCLVPSSWHFVESNNSNVSFETLAMVEPACVAQHAVLRKAKMFAGANVLIFGAGPIGIMAARWANLAGAAHVLLVDVVEEKVEFAKKMGFSACNSSVEKQMDESVQDVFNNQLADITVEGTGYSSALINAIEYTKRFGTITLMGNPAGDTTISLNAHSEILRKEISLQGIWNSHFGNIPINEWRYTVDMMDCGKFTCEDLISHKVSLNSLPDIIDQIHHHNISTCKVMYVSNKY